MAHFTTIFVFSLLRQKAVDIQIYLNSTIRLSRISSGILFDDVTSGTKSTAIW